MAPQNSWRRNSDSGNTSIDFSEVMARLIRALALNASVPDLPSSSFAHPDGRFWAQLNEEKEAWLGGYEDGLSVGVFKIAYQINDAAKGDRAEVKVTKATLDGTRTALGDYSSSLIGSSHDKMASAIDQFYSDPKNVLIPIMEAVTVLNYTRRGLSPSEIKKMVEKERDLWRP
jgi:hypothetical protein